MGNFMHRRYIKHPQDEHICGFCKEVIPKAEAHMKIIAKRGKEFISKRYHMGCDLQAEGLGVRDDEFR